MNNKNFNDKVLNNKVYLFLIAYGFIIIMVASSIFFKEKEIILPEVAALSIGSLIYQEYNWIKRPFQIFYLPSLTAILGFYTNKLDINLAFKLIIILMIIISILRFFKSYLAPAFATGLLPIITNATSYYFILSILFFTLVLAATIYFFGLSKKTNNPSKAHTLTNSSIYLLIITTWILISTFFGWIYMAAIPPVLVVAYESIHKENYTIKITRKQIICLTLAAFVGTQTLQYFDNYLVAIVIDVLAVFILLKISKFNLPPAYAMAILPMVLNKSNYQYLPFHVMIMSSLILGLILIYKSCLLQKILK